jgi:hypothetical protein
LTRLITLRLGATTDERCCGDCGHLTSGFMGRPECDAFGRPLEDGSAYGRLPECLAAEAETKRLVAVEEAARALIGINPIDTRGWPADRIIEHHKAVHSAQARLRAALEAK